VVAVVDVFDALTTDRVYRPARPVHQVLGYIEAEAGRSFDPTVVRTFLARVAPTRWAAGSASIPARWAGWSG